MNMRHFTAISAIATCHSFSIAAEKLHLTQQALSKTIREAEEECGRPLFIRSLKGVFLTQEGERLLGIIQPLLNEYGTTQSRLERFYQAPVKDEIHIAFGLGVMYSLGYDNCIEMQNALQREFPEWQFIFSEWPDLLIEEKVSAGNIDMALTLKPYQKKDLLFNPLLTIPIMALLPETHSLSNRRSIRLEELRYENFVMMTRNMQFYDYTIQKCLDAGFRPKIRIECTDASTAVYYVASGECVFLGFNAFLNSDGVKKIPLEEDNFDWVEGLLYTEKCLTDPVRASVLRFISDLMRKRIDKIRSYETVSIVQWHDDL